MLPNAPEQTEAAITPPPAPILLNADQQAHVNGLIEAARERTAKDLRDDLASSKRAEAALQTELLALKERSTPQSDAELLETQKQLRAAQAEVATAREDLKTAAASAALNVAVSRGGFVDPSQAAQLLRESATATDGTQESLGNLVASFAANNPHMVKSTVAGGVGAKPSAGTAGPAKIELTQLFGRGSNSRLAQSVMQRDPKEYRRLKSLAVAAGIL